DFQSENLIESKSFKLYLNSFNQSKFATFEEVQQHLTQDLSNCAKGKVSVKLHPLSKFDHEPIVELAGECIDQQDIEINDYQFNPEILTNCTHDQMVKESLVSHLLKSNCLITNQPDWGTLQIRYEGKQIDREKLLRSLFLSVNIMNFMNNALNGFFVISCNLLNQTSSLFMHVILDEED
ncbi:7-cyano-7-deazaguanine reductase, partial [Pasteurella multocida subsp. multocida str. Anand1_buffalo]